MTLLGNNNFEGGRRRMEVRAFTGSATTVPNATTTGVVPGAFTDKVTVVRPVTAANIEVYIEGPRNYYVRTRRVDFTGDHDYRQWQIDYTAGIGYTHLNNGDGTAGTLRMRLQGAGWIIDRTHSDMFPTFTQNGGPDFLNPDNYRPVANGLTNVNNQNDQLLTQFRFNARYTVPVSIPLFLKTGVSWREQKVDVWGKDNHRWSYIGTGPLADDLAQGWEFAYRQQFTFLPGLLQGLAGSFNYTRIDVHGMYGGNTYLTRNEVQGFIPHAANASLSWRHRNFSARILYNFTGEYLTSFNAANPALRFYRLSMKTVNAGVSYQLRPAVNLSLDVSNLFNEPQVFYRGYKDRTQRTLRNFVTISAGINGRF